jgi:hypothetical protein
MSGSRRPRYLRRARRDPLLGRGQNLATSVVLDIDETSLSNWPRILEDGFGYIGSLTHMVMPETNSGIPSAPDCDFSEHDFCADLDWQQKGLAHAIEPTLKLYKAARCIGVTAP